MRGPPSLGCAPCGQRSGSTLTDGHDHCQQQEGLHAEASVGEKYRQTSLDPLTAGPASAPAPAVLFTFNDLGEESL